MAQDAEVHLLRMRKESEAAHQQGRIADIFAMDSTTDFSFVDFASRSNRD
jgi:hypothetical protein